MLVNACYEGLHSLIRIHKTDMKRNPYRHISSGSTSHSVWRSPVVYLFTIALLISLVLPSTLDAQKQGVISAFYYDVSASNQPFQAQITALCQERLKYLRKQDVVINAQFADQPVVLHSSVYRAQQHSELRQSCDRAMQPSDGIGKHLGTDFGRALTSLQIQSQKQQREQSNRMRTLAIFALQAAEPVPGQPKTDWKAVKQRLKTMTKDGSAVLIVGVEADLQEWLSSLFADLSNVQVLAYSQGKAGLKDMFQRVR